MDVARFLQREGDEPRPSAAKGSQYPLFHDNLFSSMLGIWDVNTAVYDQQLDIFSQCRSVQ